MLVDVGPLTEQLSFTNAATQIKAFGMSIEVAPQDMHVRKLI